jgi:hypothetical protein
MKCDLIEEREVSKEDGQNIADKYNMKFMEVSSKSGYHVEETFITLAQEMKKNINNNSME